MDIYFDPKCSECSIYAPDLYEKCLAKTAEECPAFGNCHICENYDSGFCELCEFEE